jgi:hypothetical protein
MALSEWINKKYWEDSEFIEEVNKELLKLIKKEREND